MMADLTALGFHLGCACRTSAAVPATCGVAIDVPLMVAGPLPRPTPVETIATPGAVMSGFRRASGVRGPVDENDAMPVGIGVPSVNVIVTPSRSTSAAPSELAVAAGPRTPKNGMVTLNCSPVSGFPVIGPSNGGSVPSVLIITTAAAPACWPKTARATRAHVPRCVTTSFPVTLALMYSCLSQPRLTAPAAVRSTTTPRDAGEVHAASFALMPTMVFAVAEAVAGSAKFAVRSAASLELAATAIPFSDPPGEPRMYGMLPALPAADTTTTPAFVAS